MVGEQEFLAAVDRFDHEDVVGAGFHDVGHVAEFFAGLVEDFQAHELIEIELARFERPGVFARDPDDRATKALAVSRFQTPCSLISAIRRGNARSIAIRARWASSR